MGALDLDRRTAVIKVTDDGREEFPHVLRGTLVAMLAEPAWHVVVAFDHLDPPRPGVKEVLDQAARWATENGCLLSVTGLREVPASGGM